MYDTQRCVVVVNAVPGRGDFGFVHIFSSTFWIEWINSFWIVIEWKNKKKVQRFILHFFPSQILYAYQTATMTSSEKKIEKKKRITSYHCQLVLWFTLSLFRLQMEMSIIMCSSKWHTRTRRRRKIKLTSVQLINKPSSL